MPDGWIGYDPQRIADLHTRVRAAVDDLAGLHSVDPAAAGALADAGLARLHLEVGWLPLLDRIATNQAMIAPIDSMSVDELLQFLRDDDRGRLVFDLIDVAHQGDLGELDGNWSTDDVTEATNPEVVRRLVEGVQGLDLDPADVDALVATVTAVACRLVDSDEAWEGIDDEVGWYEDGVVGTVTGFAGDVWDRVSTYGQYLSEAGGRMAADPRQTMWDIASGTFVIEQLAAAEAILVEDGELYDEGPFCGEEGECIVGARPLPGAAATTFGHTVVFSDDEAPRPQLVEHEFQHVADIEDVGGAGFYSTYIGNFIWNAGFEVDDVLDGESLDQARQDAYEEIIWERRANEVEDDYLARDPEGIVDELVSEWFVEDD